VAGSALLLHLSEGPDPTVAARLLLLVTLTTVTVPARRHTAISWHRYVHQLPDREDYREELKRKIFISLI
jgi:hypothetical protein